MMAQFTQKPLLWCFQYLKYIGNTLQNSQYIIHLCVALASNFSFYIISYFIELFWYLNQPVFAKTKIKMTCFSLHPHQIVQYPYIISNCPLSAIFFLVLVDICPFHGTGSSSVLTNLSKVESFSLSHSMSSTWTLSYINDSFIIRLK